MGLVNSLDKFLNKINPFTRSELKLVLKDLIKQGYLIDDGLNIKISYDKIYIENSILKDFV